MSFTAIKQSDNMRRGVFTTTVYSSGLSGVPRTRYTLNPVYGNARVTLFNRTKWTPGVFSVNPVEHRSIEAKGGAASTTLMDIIAGKLTPTIRYDGEWLALASGAPFGSYASVGTYQIPACEAALIGALAKVNSGASSSLVSIGELAETLNMLVLPFRAIASNLGSMARKANKGRNRRTTAKEWADKVSNAWLLARYGILPFVGDVEDHRDAYSRILEEASSSISRKGRRIDLPSETWANRADRWINYCYARVNEKYTKRIYANASVYYRRNVSETWRDAFGLRARHIIPAMYELIPFSFVFDWYRDVGTWLQAVQPNSDITLLGNTTGFTIEENYSLDVSHIMPYPTGPFTTVGGNYTLTRRSYVRQCGSPTPSPVSGGGIVDQRVYDTAALSYQQIGRQLQRLI